MMFFAAGDDCNLVATSSIRAVDVEGNLFGG